MKNENSKDKGIQLSLSNKELIDGQYNDTFCSTMLKLMNNKRVPSDKYLIKYNGLMQNVVREDDNLFHAVVIPVALRKYISHQTHDALGLNGTARTY